VTGAFLSKKRKAHLDVPGLGLQPLGHLFQHLLECTNADLMLMTVQDRDKARHVRALELMRQVDVHVERRYRVLLLAVAILDAYRVADVLDADLIDSDAAAVGARLHVGDVGGRGSVGGDGGDRSVHWSNLGGVCGVSPLLYKGSLM
jgi:hypothetical protein